MPFFLMLLAAVGLTTPAVPTLPDTPPARAYTAWQSAFNAGDRERYRRFVLASFPSREKSIEQDLSFASATGGFDLKKVEESTPTTLTALVQERNSDQIARLTLAVEDGGEHRITSLSVRAIPRPADLAIPRLSASELASALRSKLAADATADRFAGSVLVAQDGKTIFSGSAGLADRERKIPNTARTRFRIGSMNKMFTAVAVMQLVQAGKIDLSAPLGTYLPDYPNQQIAAHVTIEQLLSHTGGTGDIFGPEYDAHRLDLRTPHDYIALFGTRAPLFDPGTKWQYSNYGFILLGAVIERVSGVSYYDYVRDRIYRPAGMTSTGSEPESAVVANRSIGYSNDDGPMQSNEKTLPYRGSPAGGGYSTASDLLRFANALTQDKLLDAAHLALLTTPKADALNKSYAFGFGSSITNGIHCFGHNGGAPGMSGDLEICPHDVVVALANIDPPAADRVVDFIVNRLPQR